MFSFDQHSIKIKPKLNIQSIKPKPKIQPKLKPKLKPKIQPKTKLVPNTPISKINSASKIEYDEYVITHKYLICKYKYILVTDQDLDTVLQSNQLELDSKRPHSFWDQVVDQLKKDWHKSLCRISVNLNQVTNINLKDVTFYPNHDRLLTTYQTLLTQKLSIINIKIVFELTKKITHIGDLHINFNYLRGLLYHQVHQWNQLHQKYQIQLIPLHHPNYWDGGNLPHSDKNFQ